VVRPATPSRPFPDWLACALLVAGTLLLFSRSLGYGFINYDDPNYVTNNPRVQAGVTWAAIEWAFTGRTDYWHPLTWISHMVDWKFFGADAGGHRAVNILWHAANSALAFLFCRRVLASPGTAFVCAALFAWHPLRVESVVWVTERKDVLSGLFFLCSLLAYLRYGARCRAGLPAGRAYALTLALFFGGLMSKPSLVTLPVVLLVLDFWPLGRLSLRPAAGWWAKHRCAVLEKLPFFALSAVIAVVTIRMQVASDAFQLALPFFDRLGNALVSIARYLGNFAWPTRLAFFYEHPGAWPIAAVAGAAALAGGITVFAWWRRDRAPWLLTGWLWFIAMLLPALGLLQVGLQAMADRYTYLPILGLHLALLGGAEGWQVPPRLRTALGALVLAACAGLTWWQQGFWQSSATLYQRAAALDPRSAYAEAFLGFSYHETGDFAAAETHARRALALSPRNHWAWLTLANTQAQTGRLAEAVESYARVTENDPAYTRGYYLRGLLLQQLGRLSEAEASLTRAAELSEHTARPWLALAEVRARQKKFSEAAEAYAQALARVPDNAEAHAGLGYMLLLSGQRAEAVRHWEEALRLQPDFPGLRERLQRLPP